MTSTSPYHMYLKSALKDVSTWICIFIVVVFDVVLVNTVAITSKEEVTERFRKELIDRGFAEYNSKTGVWQYKEQPSVIIYKEETKQVKPTEPKPTEPQLPTPIIQEESPADMLELIPFVLTSNKRK